jgi:hypothetical protein
VKIGLIPDFEVPLVEFSVAVTATPVVEECFDECVPLGHVFGRGDVAFPPEDSVVVAGKGIGHEGKLDEGAYVLGKQRVVECVDVLKTVDRVAVVVFFVDAHVVVEETVEADVVKANFALNGRKLLLPIGAEAFIGATGTDSEEWRGGMGADDVGRVYG